MKNKLLVFLIITGIVDISLIVGEILNTNKYVAGIYLLILLLKSLIDSFTIYSLGDKK